MASRDRNSTRGRQCLDFIDELADTSTVEDAMRFASTRLGDFGFSTLFVSFLPCLGEHLAEKLVIGKHFPGEWLGIYFKENYHKFDPIIHKLRSSTEPFYWTDLKMDRSKMPSSWDVMRLRADFGFTNGFVIPIHGGPGRPAFLTMNKSYKDELVYPKYALQFMMTYLYEHIYRLNSLETREHPPLTGRECEVLKWSAAGKTAKEIAEILSITKRTVDAHASSACTKLGAANRIQAVAVAVRNKIIVI